MKGVKLIIFDLDGTLIDAYQAIYRSFNFSLKELGYKPKDNLTIRQAVGWGDKQLLSPFLDKKDLEEALEIYRKHHKKALLRYSRLFTCVRQLLCLLKAKGYKLAVASNRPTKFSLILIKHLKIKKYFDYVLCADTLKQGKPHPEILHRILKKFKFSPQEALYVGDMALDAQTGRRAGISTVIVTTGSSSAKEIRKEHPCLIINKVRDLLKYL